VFFSEYVTTTYHHVRHSFSYFLREARESILTKPGVTGADLSTDYPTPSCQNILTNQASTFEALLSSPYRQVSSSVRPSPAWSALFSEAVNLNSYCSGFLTPGILYLLPTQLIVLLWMCLILRWKRLECLSRRGPHGLHEDQPSTIYHCFLHQWAPLSLLVHCHESFTDYTSLLKWLTEACLSSQLSQTIMSLTPSNAPAITIPITKLWIVCHLCNRFATGLVSSLHLWTHILGTCYGTASCLISSHLINHASPILSNELSNTSVWLCYGTAPQPLILSLWSYQLCLSHLIKQTIYSFPSHHCLALWTIL